jgi:methylmalonyl-CoA epimerase
VTGNLLGVDHLGIVVSSLEAAQAFWGDALGLDVVAVEDVQGARLMFLQIGDATIELIEPTAPDSELGEWLRDHGEGLHHVAFRVPDADGSLRSLRGLRCITMDEGTRDGARGSRIAFFEPGWAGAPVLELVQPTDAD